MLGLTSDQSKLAAWLAELHEKGLIGDEFEVEWTLENWQPAGGRIVGIEGGQLTFRHAGLVALEEAGLIRTVSTEIVDAQKAGSTKSGGFRYGWPRHERSRRYTVLGTLISLSAQGEHPSSDRPQKDEPSDHTPAFISPETIDSLRRAQSTEFDLSRLVKYCEEINTNFGLGNYSSVVFLSRAIVDHCPPIFHQSNFQSVIAHAKGGSFKDIARRLDESLKRIANHHIHKQIGRTEVLPTAQEIDFSKELNFLLGRILENL